MWDNSAQWSPLPSCVGITLPSGLLLLVCGITLPSGLPLPRRVITLPVGNPLPRRVITLPVGNLSGTSLAIMQPGHPFHCWSSFPPSSRFTVGQGVGGREEGPGSPPYASLLYGTHTPSLTVAGLPRPGCTSLVVSTAVDSSCRQRREEDALSRTEPFFTAWSRVAGQGCPVLSPFCGFCYARAKEEKGRNRAKIG